MRKSPILIALALLVLGCTQDTRPSDPPLAPVVPPCPLKEVLISSRIDVRMGHWQFTGPVGIIVCEVDLPVIDDEARGRLAEEFKHLIHDYNGFSLNLCLTEKPNDDWTDEEWSEFRKKPIDRLNQSLHRAVVKDVVCGLNFTEYEIRLIDEMPNKPFQRTRTPAGSGPLNSSR